MAETVRITPTEMERAFLGPLLRRKMDEKRARTCAQVFTESSVDGILTHGVYRFPRFIAAIDSGLVDIAATPSCRHSSGALEQWSGNFGPGILNAITASDRARDLAREHGMGCVALADTNHWMRGGTYGWRTAKAGSIFLGWTNTIGIMPAWGAVDGRLGNNPLVIAIPWKDEAIVLDMAMSQFSYGTMELTRDRGAHLPVPGGYDQDGILTDDPAAILSSGRPLPIGYWKGAGLSLVLDLLAAILSGGDTTQRITARRQERGLSQVFMAIDPSRLSYASMVSQIIDDVIAYTRASTVPQGHDAVLYPGEQTLRRRRESQQNGIPVSRAVWESILNL